jgi:hypothetical protein
MLTIASPNTDRSLLTLEEIRVAAGLESTDSSKDATLVPLGAYVSASITSACKVAKSGVIPPTLRLETVTETFLFKSLQKSLVLARRAVTAITSVTENNSVLSTDDYTIDGASGILYRSNITGCYPYGVYGYWPCGNTVVEYSAGYATVPDDLKYAAIKFIQAENVTASRDPNLKRLRIEGVSEREYWVSDKAVTSSVPGDVMDILVRGGYVNMVTA